MKRRAKEDQLEADAGSWANGNAGYTSKLHGRSSCRLGWFSKLILSVGAIYSLLHVYFDLLLETDEWLFTFDDINAISEKFNFEYGDFSQAEELVLTELKHECRDEGLIDPKLRVKYYLNSWSKMFNVDGSLVLTKDQIRVNTSFKYLSHTDIIGNVALDLAFCFEPKYWEDYNQKLVGLLSSDAVSRYRTDFSLVLKRANLQNESFLIAFGDGSLHIRDFPLLGKTRSLHDKSSVLLKLNVFRHFKSMAGIRFDDTVPYKKKIPRAVWRGATTGHGKGQRAVLLRHLSQLQKFNLLDVGYSRVVQGTNISKSLFRRGMSRKRLLTYKMVIISEGNDVSSGLKWALLSTSAVIMPPPNYISWLMEDQLKPWVHYIPLKQDFSDLEGQALWCIKNEDACEQIGRNGRCYMRQFLDKQSEAMIETQVIKRVYKLYEVMKIPVCQ